MAVTTTQNTTWSTATDGTLQTLFTIEAAGSFFVRLDIDGAAAGDYLEVSEYISATAAATQRQLGPTMTFRWDDNNIELPNRLLVANSSYALKMKRVAGADFTVVGSLIEAG